MFENKSKPHASQRKWEYFKTVNKPINIDLRFKWV